MKKSIIKDKSFAFAIRIVRLCDYLAKEKSVYVLSKQLLRSGTSIGALVREAEHSESDKDFVHKLSIAQKEVNETLYWLELLKESEYLTQSEFESINSDAVEIIKIVTAILKTTKAKMNAKSNN